MANSRWVEQKRHGAGRLDDKAAEHRKDVASVLDVAPPRNAHKWGFSLGWSYSTEKTEMCVILF